MASGSFYLTRTAAMAIYLYWTSRISGQNSIVEVTVKADLNDAGLEPYAYSESTYVKIEQLSLDEVIASETKRENATGTLYDGVTDILYNQEFIVPHDSNGDARIRITAYTIGTVASSNSQEYDLDNIPQYPSITQSLVARSETTLTVRWSADSRLSYLWYSTNGGSSWTGLGNPDASTGTYTITGLSAETAYRVVTRGTRKGSGLNANSATANWATYSWPCGNTKPDFTVGSSVSVGIFNPLGRTYTVTLIGVNGATKSLGTYSGTSFTIPNTTEWTNFWYQSMPNAASGTYKVRCVTSGHTTTKDAGRVSVPSSAAPTIVGATYLDTNATTVSMTGNDQQIVQRQSVAQFTATGLAAKHSATVASCAVKINGASTAMTVSGTTATGSTTINSSQNVQAVVTVTDSRGLTASKTVTVQMLALVQPSAIITCQRQSNFYTQTDITVDADWSSINGGNLITITYKARKTGTSGWTVTGTLQDNVTSTFNADNGFDWDVAVTLVDSFGQTTTYNLLVPKGMPIIFFDKDKLSVGINCFPKGNKTLEVNGLNVERTVGSFSVASTITPTLSEAWDDFTLTASTIAGTRITLDSGSVRMGANVARVLVSANVEFGTVDGAGLRQIGVYRNLTLVCHVCATISGQASLVLPPTLITAEEGDTLTLVYYAHSTGDRITAANMTVDVAE